MATEITRENDRLLNPKELAERIGFTVETLRQWRVTYNQTRKGPPFLRFGDKEAASDVRYRLSDVIAWENANLHQGPEVPTVEAEYERQKAS